MTPNTLVSNISELPTIVQELLVQREEAHKLKNYPESDRIRDEIKKLGYQLNDKPYGTIVLKMGDDAI